MSDHHRFSVIDTRARQSYSDDDQTLDFLTEQLEIARDEIEALRIPVSIAQSVKSSARLFTALRHLDRFVPEVEGWVCGYYWGTHRDREDWSWSSFSAHTTEAHAEAWLPYWRAEVPSRKSDKWIVLKTTCQIGKFVKGGPPPIPGPEEAQ